jgi:hypothetical protein
MPDAADNCQLHLSKNLTSHAKQHYLEARVTTPDPADIPRLDALSIDLPESARKLRLRHLYRRQPLSRQQQPDLLPEGSDKTALQITSPASPTKHQHL